MVDLRAVGGKLEAEVNVLSWYNPPKILHSLKIITCIAQ